MSRRRQAEKRKINPDAKYGDETLTKFMNYLMISGKKSAAEKIVYGAFDEIQTKAKLDPIATFHESIANIKPTVEVKSRRVGGATYQVPMEVGKDRALQLSLRWLRDAARKRSEKTMKERLAGEILDAMNDRGTAVKKREDTHKMAEANKAFSHFRF